MKKPFDIRNDPKFKAKVAKIEQAQHLKVLRKPQVIQQSGGPLYVLAVGINNSYLLMETEIYPFAVFWSKGDAFSVPNTYHEVAETHMLNWLMMSATDADFIKERHGARTIKQLAIEACKTLFGKDYFKQFDPKITVFVQGTYQDIDNPHTP